MMKPLKILSAVTLMLVIFTVTLEGMSAILLKAGQRKYHVNPPHKLHQWEKLPEIAKEPGKSGELARFLMDWKKRFPVIDTPRKIDPVLRDEAPDYYLRGFETGRVLVVDHLRLGSNIDDTYILRGKDSGKEKYRARYVTDQYGRRKTGFEQRAHAKGNVLFLGCSFTFGEGVNQNENFPYLIGKALPEFRVYNLGVPASSPAGILKGLLTRKSAIVEGIDPKLPTTAVITFIDDHMRRIHGTSEYFERGDYGYYRDPYFFLRDEKVINGGTFSADFWNFRWLYRLFGHSYVAKVTGLEIPFYTDHHYRLTAAIVADIRNELHSVFPHLRVIFAVYPGANNYFPQFEPYLKKASIPSVYYGDIHIWELLNGYESHGVDSHPSAMAHDLYANLLLRDLSGLELPGLAAQP